MSSISSCKIKDMQYLSYLLGWIIKIPNCMLQYVFICYYKLATSILFNQFKHLPIIFLLFFFPNIRFSTRTASGGQICQPRLVTQAKLSSMLAMDRVLERTSTRIRSGVKPSGNTSCRSKS